MSKNHPTDALFMSMTYMPNRPITDEQAAQIRDLLRCIAWIRDLQLISDPNHFDNGELFRDINRHYLTDQLLTATKLYAQLDDYCKANQIPAHAWKME